MTRARDIANLVDANGDIVAGALDNVPSADLVNDTTPQLGGALDAQSNNITSVGNLGVGTNSPSQKVHVEGAGNQFIYLNNSTTSDGLYLKAGTGASSIQTGGGSHVMNFFTSGTERMKINSSGFVTKPNHPAFIAVDDRGQGSQTNANLNISQYFTTIVKNTGNGFSNSGSTIGRFTAPVGGYYHLGWNLFTTGVSSTTSTRVGINSASTSVWSGGDKIGHANQGSIVHYMNANDYVTLGSQGGSYTVYWYSANQHSRFWGYLIA